jgi:hypothetical protein
MGNIHCVKCNLEAFGKCPKCRTVFTEKYANEWTDAEAQCNHEWHYKIQQKCIYGCGYVNPFLIK